DDRPELAALLDYARRGDVLVVWRLDRLGRSVRHLVDVLADLDRRGIEFRSLTEGLDTTTPGGRLVFHVFAAVAEFEASLTASRTRAGLAAARARGRHGGRPTVMTPARARVADDLLARPGASVAEVARALGVSRATIYRHLERARHAHDKTGGQLRICDSINACHKSASAPASRCPAACPLRNTRRCVSARPRSVST